MSLKKSKLVCQRSLINKIIQFGRCLFFINGNLIRHWKQETASAILGSDEK